MKIFLGRTQLSTSRASCLFYQNHGKIRAVPKVLVFPADVGTVSLVWDQANPPHTVELLQSTGSRGQCSASWRTLRHIGQTVSFWKNGIIRDFLIFIQVQIRMNRIPRSNCVELELNSHSQIKGIGETTTFHFPGDRGVDWMKSQINLCWTWIEFKFTNHRWKDGSNNFTFLGSEGVDWMKSQIKPYWTWIEFKFN